MILIKLFYSAYIIKNKWDKKVNSLKNNQIWKIIDIEQINDIKMILNYTLLSL